MGEGPRNDMEKGRNQACLCEESFSRRAINSGMCWNRCVIIKRGGSAMGSYSFTVVIEPDGDQFHVYVPALPGCHSFGDNQDEALANIREAIELHVESMLEDGEEVPREPEPARVGRVTVSVVR